MLKKYPQVLSGVACIICGLLQGATDPTLQGLQVHKHWDGLTSELFTFSL